ncbi:MAG: helix-turn-helix domain-containing protein [Patescibacteria group bacterium]
MSKTLRLSEKTLASVGLRRKDLDIYLCLLKLGTAPLRKIALESGLNRGTTYDTLKRLMDLGLVSFVDAKTHRFFTAEDPKKLTGVATRAEVAAQEARLELEEVIPGLQEMLGWSKHRPSVHYYEGEIGVRDILEDLLKTCTSSLDKMYRVYSSAALRDLILHAWPGYTKTRIQKKIRVKAISVGEGGRTAGLDERKWLSLDREAPTYIFIYAGKTAYVSVDEKHELFGVIIDDAAIAHTQTMIFDALWGQLK